MYICLIFSGSARAFDLIGSMICGIDLPERVSESSLIATTLIMSMKVINDSAEIGVVMESLIILSASRASRTRDTHVNNYL